MKIIVCIKQVPSTNEVKLDPETKTIIRDGRQSVINPFDTYAMEEAVRLKEKLGGTVCALSMGIPAVERLLREAMSRGVDSALLLSDRAFAGADTLATAYTLSLGVRHLGDFDLILCGRMAIDGDTAQIGPELAEDLGIPQVTNVTAILEAREGELLCAKATDQGAQQVRVKLPALLTVAKDINMPRMASIRGVKQSLQAPLEVLSAADVQADPQRIGLKGSPTQVVRTFTPEKTVECVWLEGDTVQQAGQLAKVLLKKTQRGEDAAWQA